MCWIADGMLELGNWNFEMFILSYRCFVIAFFFVLLCFLVNFCKCVTEVSFNSEPMHKKYTSRPARYSIHGNVYFETIDILAVARNMGQNIILQA